MQQRTVGFIGAGNMTQSIIRGLVASGYPADAIIASNRSEGKLNALNADLGIQITTDNNDVLRQSDVVVLSVKPQMMADMLSACDASLVSDDMVFMSIAAGLPLQRLAEMLPAAQKWVRAMPNTPSAVGLGMTGLYGNPHVTQADQALCNELMSAVGETLWVENEAQIDGVIAAAGSSPAYFFLFLEAMQAEAEKMGFSHQQARVLVQQAMRGAAEMVMQNPDTEISTLRTNVMSKGGTTAEAVNTFIAGGLPELVSKSMQAAVTRAQQMSKQL
ncbi:pyrroline-5-carboxylate reductase [Alteromonas oceanisediminis]|uniref:pyrroline-5-carboxylate reductase n=1 Tax=Alteromonas oceanisediminis TaxID=2836180 RepID=UPI001BD9E8B6|nr:pyrroline-5-carboxylate reductase [Alteromonas oceanisediminis]MBT0585491.1 pyrroline-5-carboxylate reductase [Alteromonas oceanisediminis]